MQPSETLTAPMIFVSGTALPVEIAERVIAASARHSKTARRVAIQAIGASAVNQAVKASVIAIHKLAARGLQASWVPSFTTAKCANGDRTAIRIDLTVEPSVDPAASLERNPGATMLLMGSGTVPGSAAGTAAYEIRKLATKGEAMELFIQAIGAGAVNQAVKATIIATNFLADTGIEASWLPAFSRADVDGVDKSVIQLHLTAKKG